MKRLSLDFDGVISDTTNSWVDKYNKFYPEKNSITSRDVDEWNAYKKLGLTLDECFELFSEAWSDWRNLKPMEPHLKQKTKMLFNLVHVDIVTSVQPDHINDIKKWLDWQNITYNNIVHSVEKHKLDYDIYIDDSPKNIKDVFDSGKIGLLMNQPWNREIKNQFDQNPGVIQRVYNMYHAIDVIRELL